MNKFQQNLASIKFLNYSVTNIEEQRIFSRYEKFLASIYYSITTSFDEVDEVNFDTRKKSKRLIKILLIKFCSFILGIRYLAYVLWPTPYIRDLTCNGFHYMGNARMISLAFLCGVLSANFMLALSNQYFILKGKSYQFQYMNRIKHRRLDYRLNRRFNNKFYRKFNWISKAVSSQFFPTWLISTVMYCSPMVIGYFHTDVNFSLAGTS